MKLKFIFDELSCNLSNIFIESFTKKDIVEGVLKIIIPKEIGGHIVSSIGKENDIKSKFLSAKNEVYEEINKDPEITNFELIIPSSITKINTISIGENFWGEIGKTGAKRKLIINIPKTVNALSENSFEGLYIENIYFEENSKIEYFSKNCFKNATFYTKFKFPQSCTIIQEACFYNSCFKKGIDFENSNICLIGYIAFKNAKINVDKLVFPDSLVFITDSAFAFTSGIKSIENTINSKLGSIGVGGFTECKDLQSITLRNNNDMIFKEDCFSYCSSLLNIDLSEIKTNEIPEHFCYTIGNSQKINFEFPMDVKKIGKEAFKNTNLETIEIPDTVSHIGKSAFHSSHLKDLKFKDVNKLILIGDNAFTKNQLKTLPFDIFINLNYCGHGAFSYNNFEEIIVGAPSDDFESMFIFAENHYLKSVKLVNINGNQWKHIWEGMFENCYLLEKIIFSNTIISVGKQAFKSTALKEIKLPNIKYLLEAAFENCTQLSWCDFSNSELKTIEENTFKNAGSLTNVILPLYATTKISKNAFYLCSEAYIKNIFKNSPFVEIV